jgi:hypothetical protein
MSDPPLLSVLQEFCRPDVTTIIRHVQLGELILEEYLNTTSPTCMSVANCILLADTCLQHLLASSSSHNKADSIVYIKILAILIQMRAIRSSVHYPERHIIPAFLHFATQQHDPTDFMYDTFEIILKLLKDHPAEVFNQYFLEKHFYYTCMYHKIIFLVYSKVQQFFIL